MLETAPPLYLTYDDVLLRPAESHVLPGDVDLSTRLTRGISLSMPLLAAAMDTVTEGEMALAMAKAGGIGVVHRNNTAEEQASHVAKVKEAGLLVAGAIGTKEADLHRAEALVAAGCDVIVVDTAHGHSHLVIERVKEMGRRYPDLQLIAGNVATAEATLALIEAGADAIKVGVGPGSICTTRVVSGVGVPQLSAVAECVKAAEPHGIPIIADGGIRRSGDIVKAIAAGATTVMVGSLLAGTDESPGEVVEVGGRRFKGYRGMGSVGAMTKGSSDRYFQSGVASDKLVPEGVEATVPYKGPVGAVLHQLLGGLRSGMGYTGSGTIEDLRTKARFVRISPAGLRESHVHDVIMTGGEG